MIRWIFTIILSLLGTASWAQDIVVRTGDHPSFTRVVFSPPTGTNWELARIADGYRLRLDEPATLNTNRFFERIQRDRIAAIRQGESEAELVIELACACFAEAFQWTANQVVIDIKDPGSQISLDALPVADLRPAREGQPLNSPDFGTSEQTQANQFPTDLPSPPVPAPAQSDRPSLELPLITTQNAGPPDRQLTIDPLNQLLAQQARVGTLENAIADSLGRALSQGLLNPRNEGAVIVQTEQVETDLTTLLENVEAALTPGLIARTSVDNEHTTTTPQDQSNNGVTCIPDTLIDVPSWHSDTPFATLIGDLRTRITGEFDRTDAAAIEDLAKTYITYGFGREAISTLSIDETDSRSRRVLTTLAEIIDGDPLTKNDFYLQIGCPGHAALWGFLAHNGGPLPAQPDVNSIIVSFKRLPKTLREHLAPRLAQKLNALGYQDFADDILSIGDDSRIDVTTTQLDILTDRGSTEEVAARLTELADDNPRIPPDALIRLIDLELAAGKPVAAENLTLLRSFQFEAQDEDLRGKLYKTEIRVMIAMEAYDAAQDLINANERTLTSDVADTLRTGIFNAIATNGEDADFLKIAFDQRRPINDASIQNIYAARLLTLGFPDRARTLIKGDAVGDDMMERRYLRAKAAVALGDIAQAQTDLAGISTERAQQILNSSANVEEASSTRERPLSANPDNDPLLLTIAERVEGTTTFQRDTETPLTDGRALADEAAELRRDMAALINRYEIQP